MNNYDYVNVRGEQLVKKLGWAIFKDRREFNKACLMYQCVNNLVLSYLSDAFTLQKDVLNYDLRRSPYDVNKWLSAMVRCQPHTT